MAFELLKDCVAPIGRAEARRVAGSLYRDPPMSNSGRSHDVTASAGWIRTYILPSLVRWSPGSAEVKRRSCSIAPTCAPKSFWTLNVIRWSGTMPFQKTALVQIFRV